MNNPTRLTISSCLSLLTMFVLHQPAHAGRIIGSASTGFDSFTEKYTIVEEDTLDQLTEFRTRLSLGYIEGNILNEYLRVEGQGLIGEESLETVGRVALLRRFGRSRLSFNGDVTYRSFYDNVEYSFPNDFFRYNLRAYLQRQMSPQLRLRLTDTVEIIDFDQRTEFDYDYVRNKIQFAADLDRDLAEQYHASLGFAHKSIPDSTEISYRAYIGRLEYLRTSGLHKRVLLSASTERREYDDIQVKSPFWLFTTSTSLAPWTRGNFGFNLTNEFEGYFYDEDSGAFFDYIENRSSFIVSYFPNLDVTAGIGPTFGIFVSDFSKEDEYIEFGAKLSGDYNAGGKYWISLGYEPGFRNYKLDSGQTTGELIFSDFVYHRITLFGTAKLWRGLSVNTFLNHEPENHRVKSDDATATLFSIDLRYSF